MRMKAPPGCTGYTLDGVQHEIGDDGHVDVPDGAALVLRSHGFTDAGAPSLPPLRERVVSALELPPDAGDDDVMMAIDALIADACAATARKAIGDPSRSADALAAGEAALREAPPSPHGAEPESGGGDPAGPDGDAASEQETAGSDVTAEGAEGATAAPGAASETAAAPGKPSRPRKGGKAA